MNLQSIGSPGLWIGFVVFVIAMLAVDLGVFHRKSHVVTTREALVWSSVWIGFALLFNVGVWKWFGAERGLEFLTGYLIEKSLSIDNIFVFVVIFAALGVLSLGAVLYVMRAWGGSEIRVFGRERVGVSSRQG